jgi:RNA polymerase sigma-70 factor (ECF subfamily)
MDDIARAKRGDPEALGRLVVRHQAAIGRILWRFTRDPNEWESLVQDTFVEMIRSIRGFRAEADLDHWLARIATRVGYRHWKRRRSARVRAAPLSDDAMRGLSAKPTPDEAARLLHELLARIEPPERLALLLVYIEGLELREAAMRAGWSLGGMKMRLHRARLSLAREARACGIEPGDLT